MDEVSEVEEDEVDILEEDESYSASSWASFSSSDTVPNVPSSFACRIGVVAVMPRRSIIRLYEKLTFFFFFFFVKRSTLVFVPSFMIYLKFCFLLSVLDLLDWFYFHVGGE